MEFVKDKLKVAIFGSREEMGKVAAKEVSVKIKELLAVQPEVNMIFAAAPSQNDLLAALVADKSIPWEKINAFHMDEYVGLNESAPQRFGNFLKRAIFGQVSFKEVFCLDAPTGKHPNGTSDNEAECARYTDLLKRYPTDIVCLGIGENGHIAFNDPHVADFDDPEWVKVVALDEKSRNQQVNDGCFAHIDEVPKEALTLTIPALTAGQFMYCIVPAQTKAWAVERTVNGEISTECPATILRRHPNAKLFLDEKSSSLLVAEKTHNEN